MIAIFRCDASERIGAGHVIRCLALADALAADGWSCTFACNDESLAVAPALTRSSHEILTLSADQLTNADLLRGSRPGGCDLLVVDHYGLTASYETACRGWARRILVIDDLAAPKHDCDFLLDSAVDGADNPYRELTPEHCRFLLGPDYALLRSEFAGLRRPPAKAGKSAPTRVFIMFGAADTHSVAPAAVEAVLGAEGNLCADVVSGSSAASLPALRLLAERSEGRLSLHIDTSDVASLMVEADVAIGAAGGTSWERCCLGLPTLTIRTADNQQRIVSSLVRAGAVRHLGSADEVTSDLIRTALEELLGKPTELEKIAAAAAALCDGLGAKRVSSRLRPAETPVIETPLTRPQANRERHP